tara:strand:- start:46 stop:525 length:480 start_codon:yes stop_codon:yes gene_type:complete
MIKYLKIFAFSFLLTSGLSSCSYKPIFLKKNYDFKIENITFIGDKEINSIIGQKLDLIRTDSEDYKKNYYITLNTTKEKIIVSKDSKGDPTKFELLITTLYEIRNEEKLLLNRKVEKKNIYNNIADKFKLEQSEQIIIENLSEKISDNIISSITNLNDS